MNKRLFLSIFFALLILSMRAQTTMDQIVWITTELETDANNPFMIKVKAPKDQTFYVDFGDGSGIKTQLAVGDRAQTVSHSFEDMSANKKHTIKVWGNKFEEFWVISNKCATDIHLERCTDLLLFSAANNLLKELDLTVCPKLTTVIVNNNLLTRLPLPATVTKVDFSRNFMAIGDFPTKTSLMGTMGYTYGPMRPYVIPAHRIEGLTVDLSNMLSLPGGTGVRSTFKWYKAGSTIDLIDPKLYTEVDGIFTFNQAPETEIYCVVANTELPRLNNISDRYGTTPIRLVGKPKTLEHPHIAIVTDKYTTEALTFDLTLSAKKAETPCLIAWGDGSFESFLLGTEPIVLKHHFTDAQVDKEHQVLIECAELKHIGLSIISGLKRFEYLDAKGIESISIENNPLRQIDLSGFVGCKVIHARSCQLIDIQLPKAAPLEELDLSANALTSLDLSSFESLRKVNLSANKLTSLDLSQVSKVEMIDIKHNLIRELILPPSHGQLQSLDCSYNALSLGALSPKGGIDTYLYAPQAAYEIPTNKRQGVCVDLSDQTDLVGVGTIPTATLFVWHDIRGDVVIDPADYTQENGVFTFRLPYSVEAYCTMETTAFPLLASPQKPYRTKKITIPADTHLAAALEAEARPFDICIEPDGRVAVFSRVDSLDIHIYDTSGRMLVTATANANETKRYSLAASAFYMLKIGKAFVKVHIR